jgi:TonB family protein
MNILRILSLLIFLPLTEIAGQIELSDFIEVKTDNWVEFSFAPLGESIEDEIFFTIAPPEFPGGFDSLARFIIDTLSYPNTAVRDSIEGRVITRFELDTCGKVVHVETLRGVRYDLDSACYNTIAILPDFIPARNNVNRPIRTQCILPITFLIE